MRLNAISWFSSSKRICPLCGRDAGRNAIGAPIPIRHSGPRQALAVLCGLCRLGIPWITFAACKICGRAQSCEDCIRRSDRAFALSRCAVRYTDMMRDWLALYKYRGNEGVETVLSAMLAFGYERLSEASGQKFQAVTSVPLAPERLLERGFNQAERLARRVADWYGIPYVPLLKRLRHTEKQSLKSRRGRVVDMRGNFDVSSSISVVSGNILLVDDVYTTGSTLNECARVLRMASDEGKPVGVYGLLWARS